MYTKIKHYPKLKLGADPEIFLSSGGQIVGGEKFIPAEGLMTDGAEDTRITLDGVQVELHPAPANCRVMLGAYLQASLKALKKHLAQKKVEVKFDGLVEISKEELDSLSEQAKQLGCGASENIHGAPSAVLKTIDAEAYRTRTAGGHLHVGLPWKRQPTYVKDIKSAEEMAAHYRQYSPRSDLATAEYWQRNFPNGYFVSYKYDKARNPILETPGELAYDSYPAELWVPAHDILVGNTCVMIDRDPGQVERRKLYGRAGEYRRNDHGYEYRTLSNFWLRSYPLMSLVFGLSRLANAAIFANGTYNRACVNELISSVDMAQVTRAINENDADRARENWQQVKKWIAKWVEPGTCTINDYALPVDPDTLEDFDYFLSKPLSRWWPREPLEYWSRVQIASKRGWEAFLLKVVRGERELMLKGELKNDLN